MAWRSWKYGPLSLGLLLLACTPSDSLGSWGGGARRGGDGLGPALEPMEFKASVNPGLPTGYALAGEVPYQWRAYIRYNDAWVAVGIPQTSTDPSADLVIDCNAAEMHHACNTHLAGLVQVTVTQVTPAPARLCAYKSGFLWHDGLLLNTPLGDMSLAPVASSTQDPANEGICYP